MSARLLKDAAPVIAKPITYIINLTISTGEIPPELKEAKVTPIFKKGKETKKVTTGQYPCCSWSPRLWNVQSKYSL